MSEQCRMCPGRVFGDAGQVLSASFSEIVPPDAQLHLVNAQRELLLAMALIIEHNASRSVTSPRATRTRGAPKRAARRPRRVELD